METCVAGQRKKQQLKESKIARLKLQVQSYRNGEVVLQAA